MEMVAHLTREDGQAERLYPDHRRRANPRVALCARLSHVKGAPPQSISQRAPLSVTAPAHVRVRSADICSIGVPCPFYRSRLRLNFAYLPGLTKRTLWQAPQCSMPSTSHKDCRSPYPGSLHNETCSSLRTGGWLRSQVFQLLIGAFRLEW